MDVVKEFMFSCSTEELQELISFANELLDEKDMVDYDVFVSEVLELISTNGCSTTQQAINEWWLSNPTCVVEEPTLYQEYVLAKHAVDLDKEGTKPFIATGVEYQLVKEGEQKYAL